MRTSVLLPHPEASTMPTPGGWRSASTAPARDLPLPTPPTNARYRAGDRQNSRCGPVALLCRSTTSRCVVADVDDNLRLAVYRLLDVLALAEHALAQPDQHRVAAVAGALQLQRADLLVQLGAALL